MMKLLAARPLLRGRRRRTQKRPSTPFSHFLGVDVPSDDMNLERQRSTKTDRLVPDPLRYVSRRLPADGAPLDVSRPLMPEPWRLAVDASVEGYASRLCVEYSVELFEARAQLDAELLCRGDIAHLQAHLYWNRSGRGHQSAQSINIIRHTQL
jgi:hypothetical protein